MRVTVLDYTVHFAVGMVDIGIFVADENNLFLKTVIEISNNTKHSLGEVDETVIN